MLTKLSVLTLCLSLVSALEIVAPSGPIQPGSSIELELTAAAGDPAKIDLSLVQSDYATIDNLGRGFSATGRINVEITSNITPGYKYFIGVSKHGDADHGYLAESNLFEVK